MDADVPLVVPEVNPEDIGNYKKTGIIANPNCSTIQMVVALMPLHMKSKIKRIVVSTYQAVSGSGKAAIDELNNQTKQHMSGEEITASVYPKQIAFNCIPQIDVFEPNGFTKEEMKMMLETKKIMHIPDLLISATCVRVPVFNGHAESVLIEFESKLDAKEATEILSKSDGIRVIESDDQG
jgi:aspartate-semialdehyde dehydrogenase|tara:strand:- start:128 stop:670 length:543 start_codon:yes stop_codon:yes gene_type:complete